MTDLKPLTANDPVVVQAMKEAGIEPARNGGPAKPVGSSKKIIKPKTNTDSAPALKKKKLTVELTAPQEARLLREAANRQMQPREYLQQLVDEQLSEKIGRAYVTAASTFGPRVTGPSNSYGREY